MHCFIIFIHLFHPSPGFLWSSLLSSPLHGTAVLLMLSYSHCLVHPYDVTIQWIELPPPMSISTPLFVMYNIHCYLFINSFILLFIPLFVCLLHFYSSVQTIREFLPSMREHNHGHIVSIASIAGCVGLAGAVDYCSSKFAAVGLMESLYQELSSTGAHGVQLTTVCPSLITTGMFEGVKFRWVVSGAYNKWRVSSKEGCMLQFKVALQCKMQVYFKSALIFRKETTIFIEYNMFQQFLCHRLLKCYTSMKLKCQMIY